MILESKKHTRMHIGARSIFENGTGTKSLLDFEKSRVIFVEVCM